MRPRRGVSKAIVAIALAVIVIIVGSSFYLLPSMAGNGAQSRVVSSASYSSTSGTATLTATFSPPTTSSASPYTGILPMSFTPEPPVISP